MLAALISILVLGLLVIVHELGHLLVARASGVRILCFSIGFGPRLMTWRRGHTEYAVSAIPLGGYVKMAGEQRGEPRHGSAQAPSDPERSGQAGEPWEYLSKPVRTRAGIIIAGPLVNYLTAFISLWVVFVIGYPELLPEVGKVLEATPAQAAGVQVGDRIRAIADHPVESWEDLTKQIYASPNQPLTFRIERGAASRIVTITPQPKTLTDPLGHVKTIGLIGIGPSGAFRSARVGPIAAIGRTLAQQREWLSQTMRSFWSLATGRISMRDSVTGPIGIIYLTSEAVRMGLAPLLFLVSLLSLSLAIFNLFPIPILDGGHLLFLIIEQLRGRPLSLNVQERSVQISFVLLVTLVAVVCFNDLSRFGFFEKVLGWMNR